MHELHSKDATSYQIDAVKLYCKWIQINNSFVILYCPEEEVLSLLAYLR